MVVLGARYIHCLLHTGNCICRGWLVKALKTGGGGDYQRGVCRITEGQCVTVVTHDAVVLGDGHELPDRTLNPDYFAGCTRCLDERAGAEVFCPKLTRNVPNIATRVPRAPMPRPHYIEEETHHAI
jgi:hypothetical protein